MKTHRLLPLLVAGLPGTALLLDVMHYSAKPNGFGTIFIPGSGWSAPLGYAATPLKESD